MSCKYLLYVLVFPAFHQHFCLHASVTSDYGWTEKPFTVELCFLPAFADKRFTGSRPPQGWNWLWEDCPLLAALGAAGRVWSCSSGGPGLFWIIGLVQWVWLPEVNGSQLTAAQLCLFKASKSSTTTCWWSFCCSQPKASDFPGGSTLIFWTSARRSGADAAARWQPAMLRTGILD